MFKNLTIRQISFFIAATVWLLQGILFFIYYFIGALNIPIYAIIIYLVSSFILCYLIIRNVLEYFIFRKIKLIYKVISESKDSLKGANEMDPVNTTLDEINDSVIQWAQKKGQEITALKSLEVYRKKFLGDISHELKTPIFSIQGYLHTLLEGGLYDANINTRYLERAVSNLARLQTIVDDLEMINQLETEDEPLEMTRFDIKKLVTDVFKDLELQASEKNITLSFKQGADQNFHVYADLKKIEQVVVNLINNAIKYGNEGGLIKVSFYDMADEVLIEVSDNGIGIAEEDLKHVFDRFYRAEKSRSREVGGSGLGLAIVKHIIEAHNQKINVRSTLGSGSTFGFTLKKV